MGFECGFDVVKKKDSNTTMQDFINAYSKANFEENKFLHEQFKSYEDYAKNNAFFKLDTNVSRDLVDFYKDNKPKMLDYWCSLGRDFDQDVYELLDQIRVDYYEITKDNLDDLIQYTIKRLDSMDYIPAIVTHGIQGKADDKMTLLPVDGIQVMLDDGTIRQLFFDELYCDSILVSRNLAETEEVEAARRLSECVESLKKYDMDKYLLYYWRSF